MSNLLRFISSGSISEWFCSWRYSANALELKFKSGIFFIFKKVSRSKQIVKRRTFSVFDNKFLVSYFALWLVWLRVEAGRIVVRHFDQWEAGNFSYLPQLWRSPPSTRTLNNPTLDKKHLVDQTLSKYICHVNYKKLIWYRVFLENLILFIQQLVFVFVVWYFSYRSPCHDCSGEFQHAEILCKFLLLEF